MASRPAPKPKPKFKSISKVGWFRLEIAKEREELEKLKTLAERGLLRITYQTQPLLTHAGTGRIYLEYQLIEKITKEEVELDAQREIDEFNTELKDGTYTGVRKDLRPVDNLHLTQEEKEYLKVYREPTGPADDDPN